MRSSHSSGDGDRSPARARSRAGRATGAPGVALDRRLGAAVRHARVRVRQRAGHERGHAPRTGTSRGERHRPSPRPICVPGLDDAVGEVAGAPLGLGVADVGPGPHDAVGQHLVVLRGGTGPSAEPTSPWLNTSGGAEVAVHHALERGEVVGGDEVVAVERLGVLAVVDEHRQRHGLGPGHVVEAQHATARSRRGRRGSRPGVPSSASAGPGDVALVDAVLDDGGAHAGRPQVGGGGLDGGGDLAGVVLEGPQVHHVLERPHAGRRRVRYGEEWLCVAIRTSCS